MARIYYSMAGEGRGHATRVQTVVELLRQRHELTLFAPAAAFQMLEEKYRGAKVQVREIPGLLFHYNDGRLSYWRTILEGVNYAARLPRLVRRLQQDFQRNPPDLILTDFEPALPRVAERMGIPFISLDHQHFLVVSDLSALPRALYWQARAMAQVVKLYYHNQTQTIVSSFYFPPLRAGYENVVQTGVLLRPEVLATMPADGEHLVAYFRRFGSPRVLDALRRCGREVRVYGLGARPAEGRVKVCEISQQQFLEDLSSCAALISSAGNQLVGEAMYFGKPVLAFPEDRNFEQFINAHYLRASGGGDWTTHDQFDQEFLMKFLAQLEEYRCRIEPERLCGNQAVIAALESHLPQQPQPPLQTQDKPNLPVIGATHS